MESLVRDSIIQHMNANDLFSPHQHGFMSGRSCMTQLTEVMEEWTDILDENGCIDSIYFDFMKAFDSVPHRRLSAKVRANGIQGKVASWLEAFLSGRKQRVSVKNQKSPWLPVVSGVPQGSVISSILFIIYINDLLECVTNKIKLFADDTKLYSKINTVEDCKALQNDVAKMQEWSRQWLLKFHPAKCKVMRLGTGHPDFTYTMQDDNGSQIELGQAAFEKDLGVTCDQKLKFRQHIDTQAAKANRMVGLRRRSFVYLDKDTFSTLFKVIVRPHLEYGNTIWAPSLKKDKDLIESVQRRATKLVPGLYNMRRDLKL